MSKQKGLGDAELEIMLEIWHAKEDITSKYVMAQLKERRPWALSTVMTSLARLCEKGFIVCDRSTGSNIYTPIVDEETYKGIEGKSFLQKMYGNSFHSLVASLYGNKVIRNEDIAELRSFLNELEKDE